MFVPILLSFVLCNETIKLDNIWYEPFDDELTIIKSFSQNKKVVIRSTIKYNSKEYEVTRIGEKAFRYADVEHVILPSTVTFIGENAFQNCMKLTTIELNEGLCAISSNSFEHCEKLASVEFPSSLFTIGQYAFLCCTSLKRLVIPSNLQTIPPFCFQGCSNLETVELKNISKIEKFGFSSCSSLKSIVFNNDLNEIEESAFYDCSCLKSINFPS